MSDLTRRQFLTGAAALATALALSKPADVLAGMGPGGDMGGGGGGMGGGGGSGMGSGGVIDPPVGAPFVNPHTLSGTSVSLTAQISPVQVNGVTANLMTYNGLFPGPTIRASKGDLLRISFQNDLPMDGATNFLGHQMYMTNLHTHGLHVTPGDNPAVAPFTPGSHGDNMMVMVMPGESALYEYDLSLQRAGTFHFYHPHIHGSVSDQMWGGMAGSLVVEDDVDSLRGIPEQIMVLKDISLTGSTPAEPTPHTSFMDYMHGLEGNIVMVNGQVNPSLSILPGQIQRWRIVNACVARFFKLSLAGHTMHLVGTEGGLLDKPYPVTQLLLSPGERVDILVKASATAGSYKFLSLPYSRMGMMSSAQITLLTLKVEGAGVNDPLPSVVNPAAARKVMNLKKLPKKTLTLTMGQGAGYINGIQFIDHEHCYMAMSNVGDWELWEILNPTNMDHPFHHHVNEAQVVSITSGDPAYTSLYTTAPAWKDVTIVPKGGKVQLLMPVMDYEGMTMFHCHIIEHEDIGMMGMWHLMGMGGM